MSDLAVVRLLQNPLGQEAPAGQRGDIVRVSDGRASLYLFPSEFDAADEERLRWLLAREATRPVRAADGHGQRPAVATSGSLIEVLRAIIAVLTALEGVAVCAPAGRSTIWNADDRIRPPALLP